MKYYRKAYRYMRKLVRKVYYGLVSPDITTFAIVSTFLVTIVYFI